MTVKQLEKEIGKKIKDVQVFDEKGTFKSLYAAQSYLRSNGYSYGSSSRIHPIAAMKGEYELPQKWYNMSDLDKTLIDAVIVSNDFREGIVSVIIFDEIPENAIKE